jgi:plastocyanin
MRVLALLLLLAAFCLLPLSAAWAGGGGHGTCSGIANGTTIELRDNCFDGTVQIMATGRSLTVVNEGAVAHTYTAMDGSFDTGNLDPGETARITAPRDGIFPVFCSLHSSKQGEGMAGALVVGREPVAAEPILAQPAQPNSAQPAQPNSAQPAQATILPSLAAFGAGVAVTAATTRRRRKV